MLEACLKRALSMGEIDLIQSAKQRDSVLKAGSCQSIGVQLQIQLRDDGVEAVHQLNGGRG